MFETVVLTIQTCPLLFRPNKKRLIKVIVLIFYVRNIFEVL